MTNTFSFRDQVSSKATAARSKQELAEKQRVTSPELDPSSPTVVGAFVDYPDVERGQLTSCHGPKVNGKIFPLLPLYLLRS